MQNTIPKSYYPGSNPFIQKINNPKSSFANIVAKNSIFTFILLVLSIQSVHIPTSVVLAVFTILNITLWVYKFKNTLTRVLLSNLITVFGIFLFSIHLPLSSGAVLYYLAIYVTIFGTYRHKAKRAFTSSLIITTLLFLINLFFQNASPFAIWKDVPESFFVINLIITFTVTLHSFWYLSKKKIESENHLTKAMDKAYEAARSKSEFLSMMSHEIRTPLHGVIGITDILLQSEVNNKFKEDVKVLKYAANNLNKIVNDILDYSKLEAGKVEFDKETFDIRDAIKKIVQTHSHKANRKNLDIHTCIDDAIPSLIEGDEFRLNQILTNFLDNAIKFTFQGYVSLNLLLKSTNNSEIVVQFIVTDTGIGIPKDKIEAIFESYTQASAVTTREFGGTGLGISIAQKLITQQGGNIEVKSKVEEGTSFIFELPFKIASTITSQEFSLPYHGALLFQGLKILVVEDNLINQFVTKQLLQSLGISFNLVNSGEKCLDRLRNTNYDLVLMDYHLPKINGVETMLKIKDKSSGVINPNIPVIFTTADAMEDVRHYIIKAGADEMLLKPVERDKFVQKLNRVIQKHQIKLQNYQSQLNFVINPSYKHIDLDYTSKIIGNDLEVIKKLVQLILNKTPDYFKELEGCDANEKLLILNNMKSNFKNIGAFRLVNRISELEELIKNNFSEEEKGLKKQIDRLKEFYQQTEAELFKWQKEEFKIA